MPAGSTHIINGDVRDPNTALAFASACRGTHLDVLNQVDIAAGTLGAEGLPGSGPATATMRQVEEALRRSAFAAGQSITAYAKHVVVQGDIPQELRDTVRATYLDKSRS